MVRHRWNFVQGGTYFFTMTLADRRSRMLVDHVDALRAAFREVRARHPFAVDAIVVLPDHLHAVMTLPAGDADFSTLWALIKRRFTDVVAAAGVPVACHRNGEPALWQRRCWEHTIRDDRDHERHVDYVHFNPVKHGLVGRVYDWPWSSFHRFVRLGELPIDWGGDARSDDGDFGQPDTQRR
ncbi:transposase [Rhodoplanes sp. TEM]|uniref:Transposase n=1 Tax=Rhodoplanes tepidamans TaxID=200616 RepID=A0ABT5JJH0_RHOTP|nr:MULTISPECIES: transposase [Rhodoplanes]MDC7789638.1 transposase [Rhodoplanes tepidamans]MDC7987392.1 transposase [Rhodoplanes sp. TEM]MDQ0359171.1 putative transposase [Rhodoplanes tepidamans]